VNLQSGRDGGGNAVGDGEGKEEAGGEQVVAKVDEEEEELVVVVVVEGNGGCCWLFFCSIITAGGTLVRSFSGVFTVILSAPVCALARAEWKEKSAASLSTLSKSLNISLLSLGGLSPLASLDSLGLSSVLDFFSRLTLVTSFAGLTLGIGWLNSSEKVTCVPVARALPGPRGSGLFV